MCSFIILGTGPGNQEGKQETRKVPGSQPQHHYDYMTANGRVEVTHLDHKVSLWNCVLGSEVKKGFKML